MLRIGTDGKVVSIVKESAKAVLRLLAAELTCKGKPKYLDLALCAKQPDWALWSLGSGLHSPKTYNLQPNTHVDRLQPSSPCFGTAVLFSITGQPLSNSTWMATIDKGEK
jgi:hypothetical protein